MNREIHSEVAIAPKAILAVASGLCLVSAFLPWLNFGYGAEAGLESLTPIYVIPGLTLLALNILALILKKKVLSLIANILGILGSLVVLFYTAFTILGAINVYGPKYLTITPWLAVISGVLLFVVSIVSIKKDKKQSHQE